MYTGIPFYAEKFVLCTVMTDERSLLKCGFSVFRVVDVFARC